MFESPLVGPRYFKRHAKKESMDLDMLMMKPVLEIDESPEPNSIRSKGSSNRQSNIMPSNKGGMKLSQKNFVIQTKKSQPKIKKADTDPLPESGLMHFRVPSKLYIADEKQD